MTSCSPPYVGEEFDEEFLRAASAAVQKSLDHVSRASGGPTDNQTLSTVTRVKKRTAAESLTATAWKGLRGLLCPRPTSTVITNIRFTTQQKSLG